MDNSITTIKKILTHFNFIIKISFSVNLLYSYYYISLKTLFCRCIRKNKQGRPPRHPVVLQFVRAIKYETLSNGTPTCPQPCLPDRQNRRVAAPAVLF